MDTYAVPPSERETEVCPPAGEADLCAMGANGPSCSGAPIGAMWRDRPNTSTFPRVPGAGPGCRAGEPAAGPTEWTDRTDRPGAGGHEAA